MHESQVECHPSRTWISLYLDLAKARLSALVVVTTLVGFLLASTESTSMIALIWTVIGTSFAAAGANTFNQWYEIERDSAMNRTRNRPLPAGDIQPIHAIGFALISSTLGVTLLLYMVNALTAFLALTNILIYVILYTPLKPVSTLCTLVGAVCGAIPPLMGWAAATGELGYGAWILAAILFVWQIPHFLALAWLYRDDYERGGFKMLPLVDPSGRITCQVILLYCLALIALGFVSTVSGVTGLLFLSASTIFGGIFLWQGIKLFYERTDANAKALFLGSLLYLPIVLGFMVVDSNLDIKLFPTNQPMINIRYEDAETSSKLIVQYDHKQAQLISN